MPFKANLANSDGASPGLQSVVCVEDVRPATRISLKPSFELSRWSKFNLRAGSILSGRWGEAFRPFRPIGETKTETPDPSRAILVLSSESQNGHLAVYNPETGRNEICVDVPAHIVDELGQKAESYDLVLNLGRENQTLMASLALRFQWMTPEAELARFFEPEFPAGPQHAAGPNSP